MEITVARFVFRGALSGQEYSRPGPQPLKHVRSFMTEKKKCRLISDDRLSLGFGNTYKHVSGLWRRVPVVFYSSYSAAI